MVGIQGIGGVPEPKPERPASVRNGSESAPADEASAPEDGVKISSEAHAAAVVAQSIQVSEGQGDIRADRVEAAREAIERGDFKKPEIVETVAERLSKFL